ncbi:MULTISPECIES: formylmethanofuran dehydrogenase subunit C [Methanohalophilus]|jgi:formylmethanofuran dehydrogenase subunit C|uniref:formylmethanofuran dehydrogenase n=1 Tax=Methanohalophilus euhalobius TaxID=51203 RepID=A0A285EX90_9EURY|nr:MULTISPECIES: formylmethanofuran dehydrogenase subunit C [Methanohalophilus]RSD34979.1 MAG: formylmethanofuran dehydrogenase subunit C [Methanohalophilus sp.]ODV50504.1 MAG: formylmethanofuran dehydrogenase subunit C [Methanohalophilus sp. 2-GBenrich]PQV43798.1 formylmethanofuran dehydrogenase subunit C [Methanohalophilus euhalobius]RNI12781.1 formylmethanofuran dehydrogenase subunit C [Methanohalophilus euhalobius]RSD36350.1 MAG: formylmethanofuran dehydrogenase subunit C [Methanohalophilu
MTEVVLTPNTEIDIKIEADVIKPDEFAGKSKEEIEQLIVWQGPDKLPLKNFFDVKGQGGSSAEETSIVIKGDVARVKMIGAEMTAGKITIQGSIGLKVGAEMKGGEIVVEGDADSWAGTEMKGGLLHVKGNTVDHLGCAYRGSWKGMTGGRIVVDGNAQSQIGGGLTGGEIIVNGNAENFCGIRQSGGLIVIRGNAIRAIGAEMSGGTIVVEGHITNFTPGMQYEDEQYDLCFEDIECGGVFKRFTGDFAISKKPKGILYAGKEANLEL